MPLDSLLCLILRSSHGGSSVEKHQTTDNTHYSLSTLSEDMLKNLPAMETSIEAGTF